MDTNCGWKPVDGFTSFDDYMQLRESLAQQVQSGAAKERRVAKHYSGLETIDERWFKCEGTGEVWRLIAPDPPFPGIFERV